MNSNIPFDSLTDDEKMVRVEAFNRRMSSNAGEDYSNMIERWNRKEYYPEELWMQQSKTHRDAIQREREKCLNGALENGAVIGATMGTSAAVLALIGGGIGAPVTGGASLVAAATAAGGIAGAGGGAVRYAIGKPCKSSKLEELKTVNKVIAAPLNPVNALKAGEALNTF